MKINNKNIDITADGNEILGLIMFWLAASNYQYKLCGPIVIFSTKSKL